jgi:bacterioferritin (cytochrome b1)
MMSYYGDTLAAVGEEIDKFISRMEHSTEVLDHYQSLIDIMGKSTDYKSMDTILEGRNKTIENQLNVAKQEMQMYQGEVAYWKTMMDRADPNSAAFEMYKKAWEEAVAKTEEC